MNKFLSGFAAIAVGFGLLAGAAPTTAEAGSVVNKLRDRGLGKWVDRYVQEDSDGKVTYKSQNKKSDTPKATSAETTTKKVSSKKTTSKALKSASKKKSKKFSTKKSKKKVATKKSGKKSLKKYAKKKGSKKVAKKSSTRKLSSKSGKKYKVPSKVKDRLASYGINF